jgi:hypothetical protein
MSPDSIPTSDSASTRPYRRYVRFSLAGLLFAVLCASGFFAGYRYGYDRGYGAGQAYRSSEDYFARTYDVTDLVAMYPVGAPLSGDDLVAPPITKPDFVSLMNVITSTLVPETWDDVGGPGTVAPFFGPDQQFALIIRQNEFGHDEVARLLASLRKKREGL